MSGDGLAGSGESQQLTAWIDRLDAFVTALDAIDADDTYTFSTDAWDIWEGAAISDPPSDTDPAMLLVLGVIEVLAEAVTVTGGDHRGASGVTKSKTLSGVHAWLIDELDAVRQRCDRWQHEGLPEPATVKAMSVAAMARLEVASTFGNRRSA